MGRLLHHLQMLFAGLQPLLRLLALGIVEDQPDDARMLALLDRNWMAEAAKPADLAVRVAHPELESGRRPVHFRTGRGGRRQRSVVGVNELHPGFVAEERAVRLGKAVDADRLRAQLKREILEIELEQACVGALQCHPQHFDRVVALLVHLTAPGDVEDQRDG